MFQVEVFEWMIIEVSNLFLYSLIFLVEFVYFSRVNTETLLSA